EMFERRKAQDLLASEKDLLEITLMNIRDGVLTTDMCGRVNVFNKSAELITGYRRQEAVNRNVHDLLQIYVDDESEYCLDPVTYWLNETDRPTPPHPAVLITKDGQRKLVTGRSTPLQNSHSELIGYVLVFDDVTRQKMIEAQFMLSQKMESIGLLAAGIAHEINTPMQFVGDNTQFFRDSFGDLFAILDLVEQFCQTSQTGSHSADDQRQMELICEKMKHVDLGYLRTEIPTAIEQTLDGIDRIRKIVLAMRSFSHHAVHEKRLTDINHCIESTITITRNEWKYNADIETHLEAGLPMVTCEADSIQQALLNIMINASQAIQTAIEQGIRTRGKISVCSYSDASCVYISIQDSGIGIPKKIIHRIFDPFFTTKGECKGTGQGLSIVHNIIVNRHQGRILVDSTPNEGSTFIIQLPIQSNCDSPQGEI
ncbi:MAG: ATP-binding protein, partial [Anaerolineaceae bacterium]|nr:ATP-binding protein [Anaerolineaceae bacterium]